MDIKISTDLRERVEERVQYTEFETVDDYAEFVLSEVVRRVEREDDESEATPSGEDVESRLQSLGYLEE